MKLERLSLRRQRIREYNCRTERPSRKMQVSLIVRNIMWLLVLYMSVFGGRNLMYEQYDPDNETSQQQKPVEVI